MNKRGKEVQTKCAAFEKRAAKATSLPPAVVVRGITYNRTPLKTTEW